MSTGNVIRVSVWVLLVGLLMAALTLANMPKMADATGGLTTTIKTVTSTVTAPGTTTTVTDTVTNTITTTVTKTVTFTTTVYKTVTATVTVTKPTTVTVTQPKCNAGGGNGSETTPANDCDPGNSGGNNQAGD